MTPALEDDSCSFQSHSGVVARGALLGALVGLGEDLGDMEACRIQSWDSQTAA